MRIPYKLYKKSCTLGQTVQNFQNLDSFYSQMMYLGNYDIAAAVAAQYYASCSLVKEVIHRIQNAVSSIPVYAYDTVKDDWDFKHKVLDLLKRPNPQSLCGVFMGDSAANRELYGNIYFLATGGVNRPPLELRLVHPRHVVPLRSSEDPYITTFQVNEPWGHDTFEREETKGGRELRYYTRERNKELWHVKFFNPLPPSFVGLSPLSPIYYQIEQHLAMSVHNLSLLKRGAKSSLLLIFKDFIPPDRMKQIRADLNENYGGERNAGRPLALRTENNQGDIAVHDIGMKTKDMDYENMSRNIKNEIHSAYNTPLPMVNTEHMTLSNYNVARMAFYDDVVEHIINRILGELTAFLMPRYGDTEGRYKLDYNPIDISALQPRNYELVKTKKDTGAFTDNELRKEFGEDQLSNGGNSTYKQANLVPNASTLDEKGNSEGVSTDEFDEEIPEEKKPTKPAEDDDLEDLEKKLDRLAAISNILTTYKDNKGKKHFTDKEIKEISKKS